MSGLDVLECARFSVGEFRLYQKWFSPRAPCDLLVMRLFAVVLHDREDVIIL